MSTASSSVGDAPGAAMRVSTLSAIVGFIRERRTKRKQGTECLTAFCPHPVRNGRRPCYKPLMSAAKSRAVIVAGPTASGKSALAMVLAENFGGVVINADSQQVYRDLSILTARPSAADMARVPHRLFGVIDAAESCSAGRWLKLALIEIEAAQATGKLPVVVGGTGLYLEALLEGLAELPPIPASARDEARALHEKLGAAAFHAALGELDPETAGRLAPGDTQRLTRAYEVAKATGQPLSSWQRRQGAPPIERAAAIVLL